MPRLVTLPVIINDNNQFIFFLGWLLKRGRPKRALVQSKEQTMPGVIELEAVDINDRGVIPPVIKSVLNDQSYKRRQA